MKNIQNLTIDINKKPFQTVTANVGEVASRFIRITILDNNIPIDLTGVTVYLYAKKADGTKIFNSVTIENESNGIVLAELTSQVLAIEGIAKLTLLLTKNNAKLYTKQFLLIVDKSIIDDNAIESTNEFGALTKSLSKVNEWNEYFEEASGKIEEKYTERLNNVSSQLEYKANKGIDIPINVADFGVTPKADATLTTEKIQYCLDNFSKVFIPKGIYYVDKTLVVRDNSQLILEGENVRQINSNGAFLCPIENINVIELGGDNSSIIGGGISASYVSNYDKSLILIDFSNKKRINNKITTSLFGKKTCYGVYIFGDGDGGEGFNLKIENFIDNCGVGIKGNKISGSCWFTVIYIDSYIQNCIQAIVTNIGAGGKISGTMQPIINKQNANSEERALVEIGTGYFYIDAFFWDSNTALNKYDICLKKGSLNQRILSANARIKNENKYPYNKTNTNIDPFTTSIYPTKQFLLTKSFAGMQDNLLFGANKKFTVNVTKNNDSLYIGEKNNCFSGSGVHTNIQIPSSKPQDEDYIVSYEIIFDKLRHYHCMGFAFQGGYYPCYYRMYRKIDGEYKLLQEGNPNDFLLEGKDAWSHHVPIVHNQPSSNNSAFVEGVKFEFTLNPSIDGKSYCRLTSLFYKDGTTENYLPSHGGKVYGDVTHVQGTGTILSSPNGNNYRLIVSDDGTLSTKKI